MKIVKVVCRAAAAVGLLVAGVDSASAEGMWRGLDETNWYSGPKLTEKDLVGKVVMIDQWGCRCPPCRRLLPRMEEIWKAFKNKPFVLIGSHCQGRQVEAVKKLVEENGLTYPIYDRVGLAEDEPSNGGFIPFIYVVNHRGKVVYSGRDDHEATEALVNAIAAVGQPPSLTLGVSFVKYKGFKKQIELGKPLKKIVKTLNDDIKKLDTPKANAATKAKIEEARKILEGIEAGKRDVIEEIEALNKTNPEEAAKLLKQFAVSFPDEAAAMKAASPKAAAK